MKQTIIVYTILELAEQIAQRNEYNMVIIPTFFN